MNYYVQYHNSTSTLLPFENSETPFDATELTIHTKVPNALEATGQVFLIVGIGRPRRYFLWETFRIQSGKRRKAHDDFELGGKGWQLAPPQELKGAAFEKFKVSCGNLVGFRDISDLRYTETLLELARSHKPPGDPKEIIKTLLKLEEIDPREHKQLRKILEHYTPVHALSIRQPHAEAIMRGIKDIEYRSKETKVRGRVMIYAAKGRSPFEHEMMDMADYGIRDILVDDLPRGVLIGSVDLYDSKRTRQGGEWYLRKPIRFEKLKEPVNAPQPAWFYPFNELREYLG
ncbi:ASCH domain-containing protein [Telmatocola sphagniphila]|uniref:ASCH domain-containing protein n=1 Tax=Telmatocola sphagniphila TaxID=1123043 RepID=A0A8E6B358_9BACT|nr:ASCH domain-containing protein [Telmatocola sphagniphila]QVL30246.1 ASCH domain-containing protein [Telmatocola sphagniphila]